MVLVSCFAHKHATALSPMFKFGSLSSCNFASSFPVLMSLHPELQIPIYFLFFIFAYHLHCSIIFSFLLSISFFASSNPYSLPICFNFHKAAFSLVNLSIPYLIFSPFPFLIYLLLFNELKRFLLHPDYAKKDLPHAYLRSIISGNSIRLSHLLFHHNMNCVQYTNFCDDYNWKDCPKQKSKTRHSPERLSPWKWNSQTPLTMLKAKIQD